MRPEVRRHVAARAREVRERRAPVVRVHRRRAARDVARDRAAAPRPEPHLHARVRALHRVEAAAVRVERGAVRGPVRAEGAAARVARRVDVAVGPDGGAGLLGTGHGTTYVRMDCDEYGGSGRDTQRTHQRWCGGSPGRFRGRSRPRGCQSPLPSERTPRRSATADGQIGKGTDLGWASPDQIPILPARCYREREIEVRWMLLSEANGLLNGCLPAALGHVPDVPSKGWPFSLGISGRRMG